MPHKPSRILTGLVVWLLLLAAPLAAQDLRAYVFGNDLWHSNQAGPEGSALVWLGRLAQAGGQGLLVDGSSGDPARFARDLPPRRDWQVAGVGPAWAPGVGFRRVGFDRILIAAPLSPDTAPDQGDPSLIDLTRRLVDYTANQASGATFYLVQNWWPAATPASADWHRVWADGVAAGFPDRAITFLPAGDVLAQVLAQPPLAGIDPDASAATRALLGAMALYVGLYDRMPPPLSDLAGVDPALAQRYPAVAAAIWQVQTGAAAPVPDVGVNVGDGGLADPSLAMGLSGIADWSTQLPFIDMFKTARHWVGHTPDTWGAWDAERLRAEGYLDAQGWLTAIPPELEAVEALMLTDLPPQATTATGRYRVTWDGQGQVSVGGGARDAEVTPGAIWLGFRPGQGPLTVRITATDPADPVRNIAVVPERFIPLHDAGAVFNPDWLAVVADLRVIRFMDWMATNNSAQITWADRPMPDDYTYGWRGVPVEVMVRLANEAGADPWFTLPHLADDAYVTAFASYVRDNLDPRLRVHAEWSNEVWNWQFGQSQWAIAQARDRWNAEGDAWMQFAGMRAAQVADIWAAVFGDQAPARLVRVLGLHSGWQGLEQAAMQAPLAQGEGAAAPYLSFDALAVTGYFGHSIGSEEFAPTLQGWLADGTATENLTALLRDEDIPGIERNVFAYFADVAHASGLELLMYEGGTHLVGLGPMVDDDALTAFLSTYNYSPEMARLYQQLLGAWGRHGDGPFNAFVDVGLPSKWGSWGAMRWLGDLNPRAATLIAANAAPPGWNDPRAPGTFAQGVIRSGTDGPDRLEGTPEEDVLLGLSGDDVLVAGAGDRLHGGPGRDVALLPGAPALWTVTAEGPRWRLDGPGGPIWLTEVEGVADMAMPETQVPLP